MSLMSSVLNAEDIYSLIVLRLADVYDPLPTLTA
jgi:hypothetical protein